MLNIANLQFIPRQFSSIRPSPQLLTLDYSYPSQGWGEEGTLVSVQLGVPRLGQHCAKCGYM